MRGTEGRKLPRKLVEDDLLIGLSGSVEGADARFERLNVIGGCAWACPTEFLKLRLNLFEVLLDLLLIELQGIDVCAQFAEALVEDGQLLVHSLLLRVRGDGGYGAREGKARDPEQCLAVHGGSLETAQNRCKS